MRSIQDQANLVPGVVSRSTSAGQILSDFYINSMAARGATDQHIVYDGMRNDMLLGAGTQAIAGGVNELAQAEMVYDVGGQSAEYAVGRRPHGCDSEGRRQHVRRHVAVLRLEPLAAERQSDRRAAGEGHQGGQQARLQLGQQRRGRRPDQGRTSSGISPRSNCRSSTFSWPTCSSPNGSQADTGGHIKPNGTARLTLQATTEGQGLVRVLQLDEPDRPLRLRATTTPEAGLRVNSPLNYSGVAEVDAARRRAGCSLEAGQSVAASTYHWEYQPEVGILRSGEADS